MIPSCQMKKPLNEAGRESHPFTLQSVRNVATDRSGFPSDDSPPDFIKFLVKGLSTEQILQKPYIATKPSKANKSSPLMRSKKFYNDHPLVFLSSENLNTKDAPSDGFQVDRQLKSELESPVKLMMRGKPILLVPGPGLQKESRKKKMNINFQGQSIPTGAPSLGVRSVYDLKPWDHEKAKPSNPMYKHKQTPRKTWDQNEVKQSKPWHQKKGKQQQLWNKKVNKESSLLNHQKEKQSIPWDQKDEKSRKVNRKEEKGRGSKPLVPQEFKQSKLWDQKQNKQNKLRNQTKNYPKLKKESKVNLTYKEAMKILEASSKIDTMLLAKNLKENKRNNFLDSSLNTLQEKLANINLSHLKEIFRFSRHNQQDSYKPFYDENEFEKQATINNKVNGMDVNPLSWDDFQKQIINLSLETFTILNNHDIQN